MEWEQGLRIIPKKIYEHKNLYCSKISRNMDIDFEVGL